MAAAGGSDRLRVIAGQIPFAHFDALLALRVFVGNDSGPKHLAALRGAPVVSLHMARLNWSEWGQEMTGGSSAAACRARDAGSAGRRGLRQGFRLPASYPAGGGVCRGAGPARDRLMLGTLFQKPTPRRLGNRARDKRRWADAANQYRRHLDDHPDDFPIWVQLGHMLTELADYPAADAAYGHAAAI